MIKEIVVENFTLIAQKERLRFAGGLNVIIGENGVGKSHLLKLAYGLVAVSKEAAKNHPNKELFQKMIAAKLIAVFHPDTLGRLANRAPGSKKCSIEIKFTKKKFDFSFSFSTRSKSDVMMNKMPEAYLNEASIFIPTREVLSIFPGFAAMYRNREVEFDETYYDLVLALENKPLRGPRITRLKPLIEQFEKLMGGSVHVENGRFYLQMPGRGKMEIQLVAEGIRKIAMLVYLIVNGTIYDKTMIFWDEPETNLNPKLIKEVAKALIFLVQNGTQVFIATHSLFLLRELEILTMQEERDSSTQHYFALELESADKVRIIQVDDIESVEPIVSLDETLMQSDRFMDVYEKNLTMEKEDVDNVH